MAYDGFLAEGFAMEFPDGKHVGALAGSGGGLYAFQLTTAQLLALPTVVQVLPASLVTGAMRWPTTVWYEYVFGGTAYTIGNADNAFQLEFTGKAVQLHTQLVTGVVDQAASTVVTNAIVTPGPKIAKTNCVNLGIELKLIGTTPALTLGNGVVNMVIGYDEITLF